MLIMYSKIVGLPIIELNNQVKLGEIDEIVINNEKIKIVGLLLKKTNLWAKESRVICGNDIIEIAKEGVIVNDENAITSLVDAIRVKEQIDKGGAGIGQRVVTESGKYVGRVFDLLLDNTTLEISKFYTKNMIGEKIIPSDKVVSIENRLIIIKDDFEFIKIASPAIETGIA